MVSLPQVGRADPGMGSGDMLPLGRWSRASNLDRQVVDSALERAIRALSRSCSAGLSVSWSARRFAARAPSRSPRSASSWARRGVQQVVVAESVGDLAQLGQGRRGSGHVTEGDGVVEPDHGRWVMGEQQVVEGEDLQPVGVGPPSRRRRDRRRWPPAAGTDPDVAARPTAPDNPPRAPAPRVPGGCGPGRPAAPVGPSRSNRVRARAARLVSRASSPQASASSGRARARQLGQPDRVIGQPAVRPGEVAGVVGQVDRGQHLVQPTRPLPRRRGSRTRCRPRRSSSSPGPGAAPWWPPGRGTPARSGAS